MPPEQKITTRSGMPAYLGMILGPFALAAGIFLLSPLGKGIASTGVSVGLVVGGIVLLVVGIMRIASFGRIRPKTDDHAGKRNG